MTKLEKEQLINAVGATAEIALIFYRAAISNKATREEATRLTQAYIGALMFGKGGTGKGEGQ